VLRDGSVTPEQIRVEATALLVDRAAERWLDERIRGHVTPKLEQELDAALAEYRAAKARA